MGELLRRLFRMWASKPNTYNHGYCVFDYSDSFEEFKKNLWEEAKEKKDEVLPVILNYIELAADKFEPLIESVSLGDAGGVEIGYDILIPDWLVCNQTKYPLVSVRQNQVLYLDLSSKQLHKQ